MKERIISGIVFAILGIGVLVINNPILDTIVLTLLALLGMYEYNHAFKSIGIKPLSLINYISCLGILFLGNNIIDLQTKMLIIKMGIPLTVIAMFGYIILKNLKITVIDIAVTALSIVYIPLLLGMLKLILVMPYGRVLFTYVIIAAFVSDMAAYFFGMKFGKHKLCKDISPKKSIEGAVAGVVAVAITFVIATIIINNILPIQIPMILAVIVGIVASIAGQFGDLSASAIKRHCNIKDFGKIMPGHGGVLDRFDSIMFVAPIIYIFLYICLNLI